MQSHIKCTFYGSQIRFHPEIHHHKIKCQDHKRLWNQFPNFITMFNNVVQCSCIMRQLVLFWFCKLIIHVEQFQLQLFLIGNYPVRWTLCSICIHCKQFYAFIWFEIDSSFIRFNKKNHHIRQGTKTRDNRCFAHKNLSEWNHLQWEHTYKMAIDINKEWELIMDCNRSNWSSGNELMHGDKTLLIDDFSTWMFLCLSQMALLHTIKNIVS